MTAFAPRSSAALRIDQDLYANVQRLLAGRYTGARLQQATQLDENTVEALFTVPYGAPSIKRVAKLAWINRRTSSIQVVDGWPVGP